MRPSAIRTTVDSLICISILACVTLLLYYIPNWHVRANYMPTRIEEGYPLTEHSSGSIYFILTASINDMRDNVRRQQYMNGIGAVLQHTAHITNRKVIVVENNGKRPTYLDGLGVDVFYTNNNTLGFEKGTTELTDILDCIQKYKIAANDFVVKITARYVIADKSPFMDAVSSLNADTDCILRYGNFNLKDNNKNDCITGLIGIRAKYIKNIKKHVNPIEHSWAAESHRIDPSRVMELDQLGIYICPASNTYYLA